MSRRIASPLLSDVQFVEAVMRLTSVIGALFVFGCAAGKQAGGSNAAGADGGEGGATGGSLGQGGSVHETGGATASGGTQSSGGTAATSSNGGSSSDGGAKGAAGQGGGQIGPAPTVLPCDGVSAANGWEKVTPPGDLGDVCAVALDPFEMGTVYLQMHKGGNGAHAPTDGLYKSSDCGSSWNRVPAGKNGRDNVAGEVNVFSGSIVSLVMDPVESGVMYVVSNYGPPGVFKSTNGGVDWEQTIPADLYPYLPSNGWFNALSIDPTDRNHLVGATHTGCVGAYAPNCFAETRDGAKTWRLIRVPQTINEASGPYVYDSHTMVYASGQNGLYLTTDDYATNATPTWTKVASGANGGDTGLLAYRAKNGKYYLGTDYGIVAGSSDFTNWVMNTNAPTQVLFIVGDGEKLFAAVRGGPFYTSPEANPGTWTQLPPTGNPPAWAGRWLLYEKTHHILYSSIWETGLYRLVTP